MAVDTGHLVFFCILMLLCRPVFLLLCIHALKSVAVAAFALSFAGQSLKIVADTTVQLNIDDAHRGRVFTFFDMMINVGIVLGVTTFAIVESLRTTELLGATVIAGMLFTSALLLLRNLRAAPTELVR